jgi:hypothetical protein
MHRLVTTLSKLLVAKTSETSNLLGDPSGSLRLQAAVLLHTTIVARVRHFRFGPAQALPVFDQGSDGGRVLSSRGRGSAASGVDAAVATVRDLDLAAGGAHTFGVIVDV